MSENKPGSAAADVKGEDSAVFAGILDKLANAAGAEREKRDAAKFDLYERRRAEQHDFHEQFVDPLSDLLVLAKLAGMTFKGASIMKICYGPMRAEFNRILSEIQKGVEETNAGFSHPQPEKVAKFTAHLQGLSGELDALQEKEALGPAQWNCKGEPSDAELLKFDNHDMRFRIALYLAYLSNEYVKAVPLIREGVCGAHCRLDYIDEPEGAVMCLFRQAVFAIAGGGNIEELANELHERAARNQYRKRCKHGIKMHPGGYDKGEYGGVLYRIGEVYEGPYSHEPVRVRDDVWKKFPYLDTRCGCMVYDKRARKFVVPK